MYRHLTVSSEITALLQAVDLIATADAHKLQYYMLALEGELSTLNINQAEKMERIKRLLFLCGKRRGDSSR